MLYRMRQGVVEVVEFAAVVAVIWLVIWASITYILANLPLAAAWVSQYPKVLVGLIVLVLLDRWWMASRARYRAECTMRRNRRHLMTILSRIRPSA